jgi:hypothetical protein
LRRVLHKPSGALLKYCFSCINYSKLMRSQKKNARINKKLVLKGEIS